MMYKKMLFCLIAVVGVVQSSFDKATLAAARIQMHLNRKKSELKNRLDCSQQALTIEIDLIEHRLNALIKKIHVLSPSFLGALNNPVVVSNLDFFEQNRKVKDCIMFLTEQKIRKSR